MKKAPIATLLLSLMSIWLSACPLILMLVILPPEDILNNYEAIGGMVPVLSAPFVSFLSVPLMLILTVLISTGLLCLGWKVRSEQRRFMGQIILLVVWQCLMLVSFLCYSLSLFSMGKLVTDKTQEVKESQRYNKIYRQMQILTINGQWDELEQLTRVELKRQPNELYARWFLIKALIGKKEWSEAEEVLSSIESEQPSWKKKIDEIREHIDKQRKK